MCEQVYPSDLTDREWEIIKPELPVNESGRGRPRTHSWRSILNGMRYVNREGIRWRSLPKEYPPWKTVHDYLREWGLNGTWQRIHDRLRELVRQAEGREAQPSAAILDSQSVKTTQEGRDDCGYDAGKKIKGRKRHILVDTLGLLLVVVVHSAAIQDRDGAKLVLTGIRTAWTGLRLIWADGGYSGQLEQWVADQYPADPLRLEIIKRSDEQKGFVLLPRRWVVERTFAWLGRFRRLSKDYERRASTSEALVQLAMIDLMVRRLVRCK